MRRRRPHARSLALAAGLDLLMAPAGRSAVTLQVITSTVSIQMPASAINPATGLGQVTLPGGLVLQLMATGNWHLQFRSTSTNFSYVTRPGTGVNKPVAQLQLRKTGGGGLLVPSASYVQIDQGSYTSGQWINYAYDVILQVTSADPGGIYTMNLEFNAY